MTRLQHNKDQRRQTTSCCLLPRRRPTFLFGPAGRAVLCSARLLSRHVCLHSTTQSTLLLCSRVSGLARPSAHCSERGWWVRGQQAESAGWEMGGRGREETPRVRSGNGCVYVTVRLYPVSGRCRTAVDHDEPSPFSSCRGVNTSQYMCCCGG